MNPKAVKLHPGERVIAVVPERCSGPGWSNAPTWVYIASEDGKLRFECIQPEERTPQLHALYHAGEAMCAALLGSVPQRRGKLPSVRVRPRSEAESA